MTDWSGSSWNPSNWFSSPAVAGSSGADQMTGFASSMTPGQSGVGGFVAPTADDPWTSTSQTGNTGTAQTSGTQLAAALSTLGKGLKTDSNSSSGQRSTPTGQAQSTAVRSQNNLGPLIQMLMQRANQYAPGQSSSTQPVGVQRNTGQGGLLGL
jgi:hypothetical protein